MNNNFYIYLHVNPIKQEIFYVGKGKDGRAYSRFGRNKFWKNIVNKYGYTIHIIHDNLFEESANELEITYIRQIGRRDLGIGTLVNLSDGGEGCSGAIRSDEQRKKMSENMMGQGNHRYKIQPSEETRRKMSLASINKPKSEEHIRNAAEAQRGKKRKPLSIEHRKKISQSSKYVPKKEETKIKISHSLMNHAVSIESRKKISDKLKGNIPWNRGLKLGKGYYKKNK